MKNAIRELFYSVAGIASAAPDRKPRIVRQERINGEPPRPLALWINNEVKTMKTSQKRVAAKLFGTAAAAALLFTLPTACMNEDNDTASDDPAAVSEPASPENALTAGKTEQAAQKTEQAATETKDITDKP